MISRRNYISICIMMAVLLFMFQFLQIFKETGNQYDTNEYLEAEELLTGNESWQPEITNPEDIYESEESYVLFVGDPDGGIGSIVSQWSIYTKRNLVSVEEIWEGAFLGDRKPELLLLEASFIDFDRDTEWLAEMAGEGVDLIFCSLPETAVIEKNSELMSMLGIAAVEGQAQIQGYRLFSGFLLGGERIFKAAREEDEKRQDMELTIPWYVMGKGTKTYMVGMLDEDKVEREYFPAVIWRNSYRGSMVFAVNGDYLQGLSGLGILDSFVYESEPYVIYPVVNARNTTVVNYPGFADENSDKIQELYSRSPNAAMRDVMWPDISAMAQKNGLKLTFCLIPQYDYMDWAEPDGDELLFYLQQMKEIGAEAGRSLEYMPGIALRDKLERDNAFFQAAGSSYRYSAWYVGREVNQEIAQELEKGGLGAARTLVCGYTGQNALVSYYNDSVTLQCVTGGAEEFTYSQELQKCSVETALGYANVLIDIKNVLWPESAGDQWETYFDEITSNVGTYWKEDGTFESTVLTESDARVRSFLNLDYETLREGDWITLRTVGMGQEGWFLLRTHGESIREAEGAEYRQLEEDVWLIRALSGEVTLLLEKTEEGL